MTSIRCLILYLLLVFFISVIETQQQNQTEDDNAETVSATTETDVSDTTPVDESLPTTWEDSTNETESTKSESPNESTENENATQVTTEVPSDSTSGNANSSEVANQTETLTTTEATNGTLTQVTKETSTESNTETTTLNSDNVFKQNKTLPRECSDKLGLEYGVGIFTSSDWSPGFAPENARYNSHTGWIGGLADIHYLQVDLGRMWNVSAILLQAHASWPTHYVTEFQILFSEDSVHWNKLRYDQDESRFPTSFDNTTTESLHVFDLPIEARYVVINPTEWIGTPGPAMRFELFGCSIDASAVGSLQLRDVTGDVTVNTTWEAGTPYRVTQMIQIWYGVTLRLEPGVEIYFSDNLAGFRVLGSLIAEGTAEQPIVFQSQELLSHLIAKPFWKGLIFAEGPSSTISYIKLSSADIGIHTTANAVQMHHVHFENCECGLRIEQGTQLEPMLIHSSSFSNNNFGIQFYNLSGILEFSNLSFHNHKVISISGNVQDYLAVPTLFNVTIDNVKIEKSAYAIYITSYKSSQITITNAYIDDCEYGVYLDLSDAVMSINTVVTHSTISRSKLYALLMDFKHFARNYQYLSVGDFKTVISNCNFDMGTTGLSYVSPESFLNYHSEIEIDSNNFQNLQTALTLSMFAQSSFGVRNCKFTNNTIKAIDVVYEGLVISGEVRNNTISQNNDAKLQMNRSRSENSLIAITPKTDSHCTLDMVGNIINENTYHCILTTSLSELTMNWNILDNPNARYELCIESLWVPGKSAINASFNWWGKPQLFDALNRVQDFFHDLDLAMVDIVPILREPRITGSSWGNELHTLHDGSNFTNGGVVVGNVSYSHDQDVMIASSIFIPKGTSLEITNAAFKFSNNTGILIEGSLIVTGNDNVTVTFSSQNTTTWKGLKMINSEHISLDNLLVANSRGLQSIETTPLLNSVTITNSYGPGLWIRTIDSTDISISNSTFENNQIGLKLEIQGMATTRLGLNISNCKISNNKDFGIYLEGRYIMSTVDISSNVIDGQSKSAVKAILSNGHVVMNDNRFNVTSNSIDDVKSIDVNFVQPCQNNPSRHVEISNNMFNEFNNDLSTFSAVNIKADCLTSESKWKIDNNTFHQRSSSKNASFLHLANANMNSSYWPLTILVTNNSFTCNNTSVSAFAYHATHGENIRIEGNYFFRCNEPLKVEIDNFRQNTTVIGNEFINSSQIVFRGASVDPQMFPFPFLNFSYNNVSNAGNAAAINTSGYDANLHFNFFENPTIQYDLWVGDLAPVNATVNWWGTSEFNKILARVLDGQTDFRRAEVDLFPCLLSKNYTNISTPNPDVFQIMDGVIGGSVKGNITIPPSDKPYTVKYPIRVPPGSSLTIPAGTTFLFNNNTGIYSNGNLTMNGNSTSWINFKPSSPETSWKGVTIGQPRKEFAKVRLSGSSIATTGRVEVLVSETWMDVCNDHFGMAEGHVVCKELGFLEVDTTSPITSNMNKFGMTNVRCMGMEMSIWDCSNVAEKYVGCETKKATVVTCKNPTQEQRSRRDASENESTSVKLQYVNITAADIGLQINHDEGITLDNIHVSLSNRPGMLLGASSGIVNLTQCVVTNGGDVGIDIQGSATVLIDSSNFTNNFRTAIQISSELEQTTLINNCGVSGNGGHGLNISSKGKVLISNSVVKKNRQSGAEIKATSVSFFKTLIEDHPLEGVNINASEEINMTNSAFSNNGGVNVNVSMKIRNESQGLIFKRSAFINSSSYSTEREVPHYAMYAVIDSVENVTIPITFSECQVLKAFDEAMYIFAPNTVLNMNVQESHFEDIRGTIFQVVSKHPPQLTFKSNTMSTAKNNFLVVNSTF